MKIGSRLLAAFAYIFGIPALYIVLTEKRHNEALGWHGAQALKLWAGYFVIFFSLRFLINSAWQSHYWPLLNNLELLAVVLMAGYALFCGYRAGLGRKIKIPH
ncbi:MAG: hypothetical protein ABH823_00075 [bacterium]